MVNLSFPSNHCFSNKALFPFGGLERYYWGWGRLTRNKTLKNKPLTSHFFLEVEASSRATNRKHPPIHVFGVSPQVPWERFFDAKALRSTNITVLVRSWEDLGGRKRVNLSGPTIATSAEVTPKGSLVREIPLFQSNLGWWNIFYFGRFLGEKALIY